MNSTSSTPITPAPKAAIARRTPIRRISARREAVRTLYHLRRRLFLEAHPFCQLFLQEHGIVTTEGGSLLRVPRATTVHHRNKRRGARLLDESEWMAVSFAGHQRIERRKAWARRAGHLREY